MFFLNWVFFGDGSWIWYFVILFNKKKLLVNRLYYWIIKLYFIKWFFVYEIKIDNMIKVIDVVIYWRSDKIINFSFFIVIVEGVVVFFVFFYFVVNFF